MPGEFSSPEQMGKRDPIKPWLYGMETRKFYDLERLWHDAKPVDLTGILVEN